MQRFIILLFLCLQHSVSNAAFDQEIAESLRCSRLFTYFEKKHRIPLDALHSISLRESSKKHSKHNIRIVWPWAVNVEGQSHYFDNKIQAVAFVKYQLLAGKTNIDVGCMQINLRAHPNAFKTIEHAFDPIKNVAYGAEFLRSKYDQLGNWVHAIAHYHSATEALGSKYSQDVVRIANNMNDYKFSLKSYIAQQNITPKTTMANAIAQKRQYFKHTTAQASRLPAQDIRKKVNNKYYGKIVYNPNKNHSDMMLHVPKRTN